MTVTYRRLTSWPCAELHSDTLIAQTSGVKWCILTFALVPLTGTVSQVESVTINFHHVTPLLLETVLIMLVLHFLDRHVFTDTQTTKTQVVSPDILNCLFLDNLARWYWREQTHWHANMLCENLSCELLRGKRELFLLNCSLWIQVCQWHFQETCCRFSSLNTQTNSL